MTFVGYSEYKYYALSLVTLSVLAKNLQEANFQGYFNGRHLFLSSSICIQLQCCLLFKFIAYKKICFL